MSKLRQASILAVFLPLLAFAIRWSELDLSNAPFVSVLRTSGVQDHCYDRILTLSTSASSSTENQWADCIIVKDGLFKGLRKLRKEEKVKRKKTGRFALPGFHDGHGHILDYGYALTSVQLKGARSIEEIQKRIVEWIGEQGSRKEGEPGLGGRERWIRGGGWDQGLFEGGKMPTAEELASSPSLKDKYIILSRIDLHCVWVSPAVLSLLPSPLPASPPGGEVIANPGPGVFCDNAMDMIEAIMPLRSISEKRDAILKAVSELHKFGITAVTDAMNTPETLGVYKELFLEGKLPLRLNALLECPQRNGFCPDAIQPFSVASRNPDSAGALRIKGVKLFADGALGSRGAALLEEYEDSKGWKGSMLINSTALNDIVKLWDSEGWQLHIHAIGDAANRAAVDALSPIFPTSSNSKNPKRHRIEHAQIISPSDQSRILELGIIPSIQPTHATSDSAYAGTRLGRTRLESSAYRMRSLLDSGAHVILGSDFPVESPNVLAGIYAAVARRALDDDPSTEPFLPKERLTLLQALRGFTNAPAWGAGWEKKAGEIGKGRWADWVVIEGEWKGIEEDEQGERVRGWKVVETWVGGRRVWSADSEENEGGNVHGRDKEEL